MSKKIIVVDDDDDILQIISYLLEEQGHQVRAVSDIVSFNRLGDFEPDLILLDDWLADGYGHRLCEQIKQDKHTRLIPVILISAKNDIAQIAHKSKADDYIAKPFELDFFMSKIRFWLSATVTQNQPD